MHRSVLWFLSTGDSSKPVIDPNIKFMEVKVKILFEQTKTVGLQHIILFDTVLFVH